MKCRKDGILYVFLGHHRPLHLLYTRTFLSQAKEPFANLFPDFGFNLSD